MPAMIVLVLALYFRVFTDFKTGVYCFKCCINLCIFSSAQKTSEGGSYSLKCCKNILRKIKTEKSCNEQLLLQGADDLRVAGGANDTVIHRQDGVPCSPK